MGNSQRPTRLEARVPPEVHALLKRAADLEGRTLTDFVVGASLEAARRWKRCWGRDRVRPGIAAPLP